MAVQRLAVLVDATW